MRYKSTFTLLYFKKFLIGAVTSRVWNSLSADVISALLLETFKQRLNTATLLLQYLVLITFLF